MFSEIPGISDIDVKLRAMKNLGTFSTTHMTKQAQNVFHHFSGLNGVDTCAYPELIHIEQECGAFLLNLFHADNHEQYRYFPTSGSSEALFMSLLFMKNDWQSRNLHSTQKPHIIVGSNSHTALHKAAAYLDIELRIVPIHSEHLTLDENLLLSLLDENTIGVGCALGATTTLIFDQIEKINDILMQYHQKKDVFIPLHVDAASGGFIAPFFYPDMIWDFRLEHVMSINVSSHKFGMVYPSLGWLCVKNAIFSESLAHESHYLGKPIKRYPIQFSHSASPLATQYYYIQSMGFQGYQKMVAHLFEMRQLLVQYLAECKYIRLITPNHHGASLPGIVFTISNTSSDPSDHNLGGLAAHLEKKGWHLPTFRLPAPFHEELAARIIIRHGFTEVLMQELLKDINTYFASEAE